MKEKLKAMLTPQLRQKAASLKRGLASFRHQTALTILKLLPEKLAIFFKSNISIVHALDFKKEKILLNVDSNLEYETRLHSCVKEPEMEHWFETFFKPGDVFFDIGANVGAYSLMAAKMFKGNVQVFAFEPSFLNYQQLSKNIILNDCQESITPVAVALSQETGIEVLNYHSLVPGGALHALDKPVDYAGEVFKPVAKQHILTVRPDDLTALLRFPVPNHIKLDVDGIEFKIIRGADKTLSDLSLRSLMIEINELDKSSQEMIQFISARGFKVHDKYKYTEGGSCGPASKLFNYLFVR